MKKLSIGMIGYRFMGKAHSFGLEAAPFFFRNGVQPVKKVICGRAEHLVKQAAEEFGWEEYATDWKKVVEREDLDVIDIATPTNLHKDIAIAGLKAGKHVFCEKPLALNAGEAKEMLDAAEKAGVVHMLGHKLQKGARRRPCKEAYRRGQARPDISFQGRVPSGLDNGPGLPGHLAAR